MAKEDLTYRLGWIFNKDTEKSFLEEKLGLFFQEYIIEGKGSIIFFKSPIPEQNKINVIPYKDSKIEIIRLLHGYYPSATLYKATNSLISLNILNVIDFVIHFNEKNYYKDLIPKMEKNGLISYENEITESCDPWGR